MLRPSSGSQRQETIAAHDGLDPFVNAELNRKQVRTYEQESDLP